MSFSEMSPPGSITTFYSYKGGTGRTMALANIACLLGSRAAEGRRVLMMDWDLEAPGLHRYFAPENDLESNGEQPGLIDLFVELHRLCESEPLFYSGLTVGEPWRKLDEALHLESYIQQAVAPGVDLMRAGRFATDGNNTYAERVASFDWADFFNRFPQCVEALRLLLSYRYTHVLVDSRTGVGDVSGLCTMVLPERLVAVFTPNEQSLSGLLDTVAQAIDYRRASDDFRPFAIFPLPSRIEENESELRTQWRRRYQEEFEALFRGSYGLVECNLGPYFDEVSIPHRSFFAYGEKVAARSELNDALSLRRAYERFFDYFVALNAAWEVEAKPVRPVVPSAPVYDVFLSGGEGSRDQSDFVRGLADWLDSQGVRSFYPPRDILPGEKIGARIRSAYVASRTIAVLVGLAHEQSVLLEPDLYEAGRRIIPVLIPGTEPQDIPVELRSRRWVDLTGGLGDRAALTALIQGILGRTDDDTIITATWRRPPLYSEEIPVSPAHLERIASALLSGHVTPVLGPLASGTSDRLVDPLADRDGLLDYLASQFSYPSDEPHELPRVCQFVETLYSRSQLEDALLSYHPTTPVVFHHIIANIERLIRERNPSERPTIFITTSYDNRLEEAFALSNTPFKTVAVGRAGPMSSSLLRRRHEESVEATADAHELPPSARAVILKIQGDLSPLQRKRDRPVLTEDDYIDWAYWGIRNQLPKWLVNLLRKNSFLFVGLDVRQWTDRLMVRRVVGLRRVGQRFEGHSGSEAGWAVASEPSAYTRRLWERYQIEPVTLDPSVYMEELQRVVLRSARG